MAGPAKSSFIWFDHMTGDLEEAAAFYSKVVGWDVHDSGMPGMRYLLFGKDGKDIGGMMSWSSIGLTKPASWKGHLWTGDVDAEVQAVVADGGAQHRPPSDVPGVGRFAVVADPQGAEFLLFQPSHANNPPQPRPNEVGAVGWYELSTTDWKKAWQFYSGHYGWTEAQAVDMGPMGTYQTFTTGGETGGGMMNLPPEGAGNMAGPAWLFYFTVEDIGAATQRIKDHGGAITHGPAQVPGGAWIVQGTDSQGGSFALTAAK